MTEPIPRVIAKTCRRSTAEEIRSSLNMAATHASLYGGNRRRRYYTVERRWPMWHVVKHYERETNT